VNRWKLPLVQSDCIIDNVCHHAANVFHFLRMFLDHNPETYSAFEKEQTMNVAIRAATPDAAAGIVESGEACASSASGFFDNEVMPAESLRPAK